MSFSEIKNWPRLGQMSSLTMHMLALVLMLLTGGASASTCKLDADNFETRVKNADLVFVGRLEKKLSVHHKFPPQANQHALVKISSVLKGNVPGDDKRVEVFYFLPALRSEKEIKSIQEGGFGSSLDVTGVGCTLDYFDGFDSDYGRKSEFLIYARKTKGKFFTSFAFGSMLAEPGAAKLEIEKLRASSNRK